MTLKSLEVFLKDCEYFSSDSRCLDAKGVFVALVGAQVDGHRYVEELLQKNIRCIVSHDFSLEHELLFKVDSTEKIHGEVARIFRKRFQGSVIAVCGSNGKTSTKDFLFELLKEKGKTVKTQNSQNGALGIPKTLEALRDDVEWAVVEVGTDAPGDMQKNLSLVQPDIGLLTSIGFEHLEGFKNIEGVLEEELEIFRVLKSKPKTLFIPQSEELLSKLHNESCVVLCDSQKDSICAPDHFPSHQKQNFSLALNAALKLGLTNDFLKEKAQELELPPGRGRLLEITKTLWVIEDHYNSNPSSLKLSLLNTAELARKKNLALNLVLGDMLELGDSSSKLHREIMELVCSLNPQKTLFVGSAFKEHKSLLASAKFYKESKDAFSEVESWKKDSALVLFKGSRGIALEHCLEALISKN